MRKTTIILTLFFLTACQTVKPVFTTVTDGFGDKVNLTDKAKYYNVFETTLSEYPNKNTALNTIVKTINLNTWLMQVSKLKMEDCPSDPVKSVRSTEQLMICFDTQITDEKTKNLYRRQLVDNTIRYSDANCELRQDNVGIILKSGNVTGDFLTTLANSIGAIATDSVTSRIASGVSEAGNSVWGKTKSEFLAGSTFEKVKNNIKEKRNVARQKLDTFVSYNSKQGKYEKSYMEWPLSAVIRDLDTYDRTCDMFK